MGVDQHGRLIRSTGPDVKRAVEHPRCPGLRCCRCRASSGVLFVAPGDPAADGVEVVVGAARGDPVKRLTPARARAGPFCHGSPPTWTERSIVEGRGRSRRSSRSSSPSFRTRSSPSAKVFQMSACRATTRSIFCSPPPAIEDRHPAHRRRVQRGEPLLDPRKRLGELGHPAPRRRELVPVLEELAFLEAGADPEHDPTVADVIDGPGHVGQQVGVAVAVAADQDSEADPRGLLCPGAEDGPAFDVLALGYLAQREGGPR